MAANAAESPQDVARRASKDEVVAGFQTKSDKIRELAKAGYSRSEIADFLGIRYQFVRNVLVNDKRVGRTAPSIQRAATRSKAHSVAHEPDVSRPASLRVEADGRVSVPKGLCQALGLKEGDPVIVAVEEDAIRLMGVPAAVKRAQAIVRRFVQPGVSLVDELLAERRAEAKREDSND